MRIYIEYVLLDNLAMDACILLAVSRLLRRKINAFSIVFGAIVGSVISLFLPLISASKTITVIVRWLSGFIVFIIGCLPKSKRDFILGVPLFFAVTFVFGGAAIGIAGLLGVRIVNGSYYAKYPVLFILFTAGLILFLTVRFIKFIEKKKAIASYIYSIKIYHKGREYQTCALIDTGNRVIHKGKPVAFISSLAAQKLLGEDFLPFMLSPQKEKVCIASASGKNSELMSFYVDKIDIIELGQMYERVCFAIVFREFYDAESYEILLSPYYIKGDKNEFTRGS